MGPAPVGAASTNSALGPVGATSKLYPLRPNEFEEFDAYPVGPPTPTTEVADEEPVVEESAAQEQENPQSYKP